MTITDFNATYNNFGLSTLLFWFLHQADGGRKLGRGTSTGHLRSTHTIYSRPVGVPVRFYAALGDFNYILCEY